jgi:hypothetical protein
MEFAVDFFAMEIRSWHGEEPLWKVFWGYGVLTSAILATIYAVAIYNAHLVLQQVLLLCFVAYTIWILISVWRCAENTQEKFWGLLARFLTVAWAGNTIMIITFLQIDLAMKYLGP